MTVDATTRVWSTEVTFTGAADSTGTQRFKFDVYGNWTENYGDTEADGIADKGVPKTSISLALASTRWLSKRVI